MVTAFLNQIKLLWHFYIDTSCKFIWPDFGNNRVTSLSLNISTVGMFTLCKTTTTQMILWCLLSSNRSAVNVLLEDNLINPTATYSVDRFSHLLLKASIPRTIIVLGNFSQTNMIKN